MSSTTDDRVIRTLRSQAWERAKGELACVIQTYWDEGTDEGSKFRQMEKAQEDFIELVESWGLAE